MYLGRLVGEGTLAELAGEPTEIVITTTGLDAAGAAQVARHPVVLNVADDAVRVGKADETQLWTVLESIHQAGGQVFEVTRPRPTLQDVFVRAIREEAK